MEKKDPLLDRKLQRITDDTTDQEFSVVSYNILCDRAVIADPQFYFSSPNDVVLRGPNPKESVRHIQLMKELRWLNADVICLQEVDPFYFQCLLEELGPLGYEGFFEKHRENVDDDDGLATFFRTETFVMKYSKSYRFNEILEKICELRHFENFNKHNQKVAQYVMLEEVSSGKQLALGNVHIVFGDWKEPDVQALQSCLFLTQLQQFSCSFSQGDTTVPWVLCGDFNMYPYFPVYELIASGRMSDECCEKLNPAKFKYPEIIALKEDNRDSFVLKNCKQHFSHPLQDIKSAYKTILDDEPLFTHYNLECVQQFPVKGTLDYIWYSSDTLQVNAVLELVKEEVIKPHTACPNKFFPSDHLSLKACFSFK